MIDAFQTHIYNQNQIKTKQELCREMASVRANILAKTPEQAAKMFQEYYKKCLKIEKTGEI